MTRTADQLRPEVQLHNLDLSRVTATRMQVLDADGHRRTVVRVVHAEPACDMAPFLAERGLSLTRDCTSLGRAELFMLRIAYAVQPQERIVVRQALGVCGMSLSEMRSTPLTSEELDRYREQVGYRKRAAKLMEELAEAKRQKAERDEAARIEREIRSRYHITDAVQVDPDAAQQMTENAAAAKRRVAKLKSPSGASAQMTLAMQEIPHHE